MTSSPGELSYLHIYSFVSNNWGIYPYVLFLLYKLVYLVCYHLIDSWSDDEGEIVSYKNITAAMETVESYCKQMDCDEHTMKLFNDLQAKFKALRASKEKSQKPLTHFFRPQQKKNDDEVTQMEEV